MSPCLSAGSTYAEVSIVTTLGVVVATLTSLRMKNVLVFAFAMQPVHDRSFIVVELIALQFARKSPTYGGDSQ